MNQHSFDLEERLISIQSKNAHLPALIHNEITLNYQQLWQQVQHWRHEIVSVLLINQASSFNIGVSCTRSTNLVNALVAIHLEKCCYVPLDSKLPTERLLHIISVAEIQIVICEPNEISFYESLGLQCLTIESINSTSPSEKLNHKNDSAYILFTSGSTGVPKGVQMGFQALNNLLLWQEKNSSATESTRTLQFSPLTFDVSFQEIFSTISTGGILVLLDESIILEPAQLMAYIQNKAINRLFLPFVALQYLAESAQRLQSFPSSLKEIITAGEQLKITPQIIQLFQNLNQAVLYNQYGPTESHVVSQLKLEDDPSLWPALPSIGIAIDHLSLIVVDENLQQVEIGTTGELLISGICLAKGYIGQTELTNEKFILWPDQNGMRYYRSGDLVTQNPDGSFNFLGRIDHQVKINGYRIEPAEIELLLAKQNGVSNVAVVHQTLSGEQKLVAYLQGTENQAITEILRKAVSKHLPHYMMPAAFVWLAEFPKTSSGKIDRKGLPHPLFSRPALASQFQKADSETEQKLVSVWETVLGMNGIGINDNFFELGGTSLLAVKFIAEYHQRFQVQIPITQLFQHPTIHKLATWIEGKNEAASKKQAKNRSNQDEKIAVIGMAGRFPGANTINELWEILKNGQETIRHFSPQELDYSILDSDKNNKNYVAARGIIDRAEEFDAHFFGINPKMAQIMDPQHRIFLEIAHEALESSGIIPSEFDGHIGVFAGTGNNSYYPQNIAPHADLVQKLGAFQVMTYNEKDYIASRTAYSLNLTGPAISVYSGCSTSLLAIAQATDSLLSGQCDAALAGGVSITVPINSGQVYDEGAMFSKDGHTRPFDAEGSGTVFSDGAGVILLKRLSDAQKDGDTIYAIICGTGVNNDGSEKGAFTSPSAAGQAGAILQALNQANWHPDTISYIEAHGTATPIGDPIEFEGLAHAFQDASKKQYCALGSIKSNIGHLTAAAGVAGFIKTCLSLHHQLLPPTLHFRKANAAIDLENSPFYVNTSLKPLVNDLPLRAGISSFGVGGTNVHILVEQAEKAHKIEPISLRPYSLLCWTAKSEKSLTDYGTKLSEYLKLQSEEHLEGISHALINRQTHIPFRAFAIGAYSSEIASSISAAKPQSTNKFRKLLFVFSGQGSQFAGMGADLYKHEAIYKQAIDECAEILVPILGKDIRHILFDTTTPESINHTSLAQPALFITSYALAKLWRHWGFQPEAFIGHSIGEYVAAHLAGVFSLEDALTLVTHRGRLMGNMPEGAMLSVKLSESDLLDFLPDSLSLAAVNHNRQCVVSGRKEDILEFKNELDTTLEITNTLLKTSHAFHSAMMDDAALEFQNCFGNITLLEPTIPIVSTATGKWLTAEEASNPQYWCNQLRNTVRFYDAVQTAQLNAEYAFIECGPSNVCTTLIKQITNGQDSFSTASLPQNNKNSDYHVLLASLGNLWTQGYSVNWKAYYGDNPRPKYDLPTYAFDKQRYWIDPPQRVISSNTIQEVVFSQIDSSSSEEIPSKAALLSEKVLGIIDEISGLNLKDIDTSTSFIEAGLDSLVLTSLAIALKKEFQVSISFRQLNEDYSTLQSLLNYLETSIPKEVQNRYDNPNQSNLNSQSSQYSKDPLISNEEMIEIKKPFGAIARIEKQKLLVNEKQIAFIEALTKSYNAKTIKSKNFTQEYRSEVADPRVVTGFRPLTKELVYPLVVDKSKGSRLWDIDGNEYIDVLNGFGSNLLGHSPEIITKALHDQIDAGYEVGPMHPYVGEVSRMFCQFTGAERVGFCNTGSEAVLGAMRIARTVTGRKLIVAFAGAYHGIVDEVIVRGSKALKTFPASAGIMAESVQNMLILDYGTVESLEIIKQRAHELAAVLVEPVQSRRPEFLPIQFLKDLREITEQAGTALIFDEVITGLRMHTGGMQAILGIKADMGTYGKILGGGMPIGAIAGKKLWMDTLDGGFWQYGDESVPESGVTYFAGTFVRHPLAMAAAKATLRHLKEKGNSLQERLTNLTTQMADEMNAFCESHKLPLFIAHYGSLWKVKWHDNVPYSELLFTLMRQKGIHIWDGFPCFMTAAHTIEETKIVINLFQESLLSMIETGFFENPSRQNNNLLQERILEYYQEQEYKKLQNFISNAPIAGARLGKDPEGNPAWYIADPELEGKFLQVQLS